MTFGQQLKQLREQFNLTQRHCSQSISMNATYWNKLERDAFKSTPTIGTVKDCARAIGSEPEIRSLLLIAAGHKCAHSSNRVTADVLEGATEYQIQWCQICGAYRINYGQTVSDWREPEKEWCF